jgi:hypothetical protein
MINTEIQNTTICYSPYGYIEVDKNELTNNDIQLINFTKKINKISGRINVLLI